MISLYLLAAHMLGDFVLQSDRMAKAKLTDVWERTLHVTGYTLGFIPFLGMAGITDWRNPAFLGCLWVTHFITDSRRWASPDPWPPKPILVDQTIHLVTLAVLGWVFGF
jgi:hypothetical protein